METKQIKIPIYKLHRYPLRYYAENEKKMFLYVTKKIYEEYKNTNMFYNFGEEIYKVEYINHMQYDDDLIDYLKPKIIYYKEDYLEETKYNFIYLMKFKVEEMKE